MGLHAVVIDERVVDVEQKDNIRRFGHRIPTFFRARSLPQGKPGNAARMTSAFLGLAQQFLGDLSHTFGLEPEFSLQLLERS